MKRAFNSFLTLFFLAMMLAVIFMLPSVVSACAVVPTGGTTFSIVQPQIGYAQSIVQPQVYAQSIVQPQAYTQAVVQPDCACPQPIVAPVVQPVCTQAVYAQPIVSSYAQAIVSPVCTSPIVYRERIGYRPPRREVIVRSPVRVRVGRY